MEITMRTIAMVAIASAIILFFALVVFARRQTKGGK